MPRGWFSPAPGPRQHGMQHHCGTGMQMGRVGILDFVVADAALAMLDIDADGLDEMDKRILETLIYKFEGGPVGLNSLAVAIGEDSGTLEDVNEPYLIMQGYVKRTPQGRVALSPAYKKIGAPLKTRSGELFS
ncbi:MAG: hypothetical protein RLZZ253_2132 [Verrucomicrobiota bacterium]